MILHCVTYAFSVICITDINNIVPSIHVESYGEHKIIVLNVYTCYVKKETKGMPLKAPFLTILFLCIP